MRNRRRPPVSHVPMRDRLRNSRGLKRTETGQCFLEGFEAVAPPTARRQAWRRPARAWPSGPCACPAGRRCHRGARTPSEPSALSGRPAQQATLSGSPEGAYARQHSTSFRTPLVDPTSQDDTPEAVATRLAHRLHAVLGKLDADERAVVLGRYADGRTLGEVAAEIGMTDGMANVLLRRGLRRLRELLIGVSTRPTSALTSLATFGAVLDSQTLPPGPETTRARDTSSSRCPVLFVGETSGMSHAASARVVRAAGQARPLTVCTVVRTLCRRAAGRSVRLGPEQCAACHAARGPAF